MMENRLEAESNPRKKRGRQLMPRTRLRTLSQNGYGAYWGLTGDDRAPGSTLVATGGTCRHGPKIPDPHPMAGCFLLGPRRVAGFDAGSDISTAAKVSPSITSWPEGRIKIPRNVTDITRGELD